MSVPTSTGRKGASRLFVGGIVIGGLGSVGVLSGMIINAVEKVRSGHGLDTYHTFWLVEFNWVGFLVLCTATLIAIIVGLGFRFYEYLELRSLFKKYGSRKNDT